MNLPYMPRLLCLAMACFFLVYVAAALATAAIAPRIARRARGLEATRAARFLLTLRLLPLTLGLSVSVLLCVPSYLAFEAELSEEPVGMFCVALALGGAALCGLAGLRAVRALIRSLAFTRNCRHSGTPRTLAGERACVIETVTPCLALTGILRSRVVISSGIVNALSEEELAVVLRHERAHKTAWDNLKRLCLLLAPGSKALEHAWVSCAEYAADQKAVGGDPRQRLALASALVRVARFGADPHASAIATSFMADPCELENRIERLLACSESAAPAQRNRWLKPLAALTLMLAIMQPAALSMVHDLLEILLQ